MRIDVGPAKRDGPLRTIFHRPLIAGDFRSGTAGAVIVSINAEGIYADGSRYRYLMEFTRDDIQAVLNGS